MICSVDAQADPVKGQIAGPGIGPGGYALPLKKAYPHLSRTIAEITALTVIPALSGIDRIYSVPIPISGFDHLV